ncbi:MAG: hypothetical protein ACI9U2_004541 [Bradymonadia bacterium]|jgi:uncharacterized protein (TIGR02996 family)
MQSLEDAIAQLTVRDLPRALDTLLRAWRAVPAAEIAVAIERLDAVIRPVLPPLTGKTATARFEDWQQLAGAGRAVDQSVLAAELAVPSLNRMTARVDWLLGQPRDPRWTRPVADLFLYAWSHHTQGHARLGNRAFKVLVALKDPRIFTHLRGKRATPDGYFGASLSDRLETLSVAVGGQPEALPADTCQRLNAALDGVERAPPPSLAQLRPVDDGERQLLAMIHAEPGDVDARRVFADWLEQAGSPRAEFLRLQLKAHDGRAQKKDARRIAALLAQHQLGWLSDLAPHVKNVVWTLGFPSGADIKFRGRGKRDAALQSPQWCTLTEVVTSDPAVTAHSALAQVRQLGRSVPFRGTNKRLTAQPVKGLPADQPLAITRLVVDAHELADVDFGHLPALKVLEVLHRRPDRIDALMFTQQIESLGDRPLDRLVLWGVDRATALSVRALLPNIARFEVSSTRGFRVGVTPTATGCDVELVWPWSMACRSFTACRRLVEALNPDRVQIHTPGFNHPTFALDSWAKALAPAEVELPRARRT